MEGHSVGIAADVIGYIEAHLREKMDLGTIADAVHYSKYHLHRMFTHVVGITIHDYIQRRQLTEAAKLLVFSEKSVMEIALIAGYESQQAFTGVFKSMYKQTPIEYREKQVFYPLQLEFILNRNPSVPEAWTRRISYACLEDVSKWLEFVSLVIDGFPCYKEQEHQKRLLNYIEQKQALIMWDKDTMIGAAAFSHQRRSIDFLGVHPQYRRHGAAGALLDFMVSGGLAGGEVSITTFREGDQADTGQRAEYKRLGFVESELLIEFGYPTQRMVLGDKPSCARRGIYHQE